MLYSSAHPESTSVGLALIPDQGEKQPVLVAFTSDKNGALRMIIAFYPIQEITSVSVTPAQCGEFATRATQLKWRLVDMMPRYFLGWIHPDFEWHISTGLKKRISA